MQDLSITQEYMLCAMNEKGKISGFNVERLICMVASGLLEMQMDQCIELENKKVRVIRDLPEDRFYLKPLYDFINLGRPVKVEKIIEEYTCSISDKKIKEFMNAVGTSLNDMGLVTITETGIIGKRKSYLPKKEAINNIVDMIRAELLEEGEITEDIACLVVLLEKSKMIKTYFSSFEQKEIKQKLKVIMNSDSGKLIKYMVDYIESMVVMMAAITTMFTN